MESMNWRERLRRLVLANPRNRWSADPVFIVLGIILGVWVADARENVLSGIGVAVLVLALREFLFHFFVKGRRRSGTSD